MQLGIAQNWGTLNMGWLRWLRFVGPQTLLPQCPGIWYFVRSIFLLQMRICWGTLNPWTLSLRMPDSAMRPQARTPQSLSFRLAEAENQLSVVYSQLVLDLFSVPVVRLLPNVRLQGTGGSTQRQLFRSKKGASSQVKGRFGATSNPIVQCTTVNNRT